MASKGEIPPSGRPPGPNPQALSGGQKPAGALRLPVSLMVVHTPPSSFRRGATSSRRQRMPSGMTLL